MQGSGDYGIRPLSGILLHPSSLPVYGIGDLFAILSLH